MAVTNRVSANEVTSNGELAKQYRSELTHLRRHLSRRESGEEQSAAVSTLKQQVATSYTIATGYGIAIYAYLHLELIPSLCSKSNSDTCRSAVSGYAAAGDINAGMPVFRV